MKKYKRVLLKISGEALASPSPSCSSEVGIHSSVLAKIVSDLRGLYEQGVQIAIVIGGGNIFRGVRGVKEHKLTRTASDHMGMLATVINGLALEQGINNVEIPCVLMSSLVMPTVCEQYVQKNALSYLNKNSIVILCGGTGNPFFTTDSAAALRACELECDLIMKATKVDGVYTKDPHRFKDAVFLPKISYDNALEKKYEVMDITAFTLVKSQNIPIMVFSIYEHDSFRKHLNGEGKFTIIAG